MAPQLELGVGEPIAIQGDIRALMTSTGVTVEGTDPALKQLEGMRDFVITPDDSGLVYLRGKKREKGTDVDRWSASDVPKVIVNIIQG